MEIRYEDIPQFETPADLHEWLKANVDQKVAESFLAFVMDAYKRGLRDKSIGIVDTDLLK